jgi:hypothetical protein
MVTGLVSGGPPALIYGFIGKSDRARPVECY